MNTSKVFLIFFLVSLSLHSAVPALSFKENKQQWPKQVSFAAELAAGQVFIETSGFCYQLFSLKDIQRAHDQMNDREPLPKNVESIVHGHNFKVEFVKASLSHYQTGKKQPEYYNYFLGNDPSKWASDVKAFESVLYTHIYQNIDLNVYSQDGQLKYDFIVKAGADPTEMRLKYHFTQGIRLDHAKLIIQTSLGDITEHIPEAYQIINHKKIRINCSYHLENKDEISFLLDSTYNPSYDLVIDPTVVVSSYSGTESVSYGLGLAPDKLGNMYLYSMNMTKNYPVTFGAFQTSTSAPYSCVLSKFNSNGTAKYFSTYIGGNKEDVIINCVIQKNEIAVFGTTLSDSFPIKPNAFQTKFGGGKDYFILKLDTSGKTLLASTYLGGKRLESVSNVGGQLAYYPTPVGEMIMDPMNNCYVIGNSNSFDFPVTAGCFKFYTDTNNFGDMILSKLNSDLSKLNWSTYYGGKNSDSPIGLRLSNKGVLYCAGSTVSDNFYTSAGVVYPNKGNYMDMVAFSMNGNTGQVLASTFLGAKATEALRLDIDLNENLYIAGISQNPQSVTVTPGAYTNSGNILFYKLKKDLSQIYVISKFGYPNTQLKKIEIDAMNVDSCGYIYFGGFGLPGLPVSEDAFKSTGSANGNMYFGIFNPDFSALKYGSYYGGEALQFLDHDDGGLNYFDDRGYFYHAVCVSKDFPISPNAYSPYNIKDSLSQGGSNMAITNSDAFVKIDLHTFVNATSSLGGEIRSCNPITTTFVASSNHGVLTIIPGDGSPAVHTSPYVHSYNSHGIYNAYVISGTDSNTCNITDTIKTLIKFGSPPLKMLSDTTANCVGLSGALNAGNEGSSYFWNTWETTQSISPVYNGNYFVIVDNGFCSSLDSSYVNQLNSEYPMILPNIITPNEDGVNDYWDFSKHALEELEFIVYNRWGNVVFKTNNANTRWSGVNQKGEDLSESVYYWFLKCQSSCQPNEKISEKGWIQIIR